jgi:hypothetical protein
MHGDTGLRRSTRSTTTSSTAYGYVASVYGSCRETAGLDRAAVTWLPGLGNDFDAPTDTPVEEGDIQLVVPFACPVDCPDRAAVRVSCASYCPAWARGDVQETIYRAS